MEVEKKTVNGFGIASLVFGIVGILTICGCGVGFFFGLFGVIFGILGLTVLKRSGKGLAIAGLIVSGVALLCGTFWMFLYIPKHRSNSTSSNYASTSTQTTSSSSNSSISSSSNNKPETSSYSSSADLEKDKEEIEESWNALKDEFKDGFKDIVSDAYEEAKQEMKENSSDTSNSSSSSSTSSSSSSSNQVTPELKEFCDSYEAFMDQYIELMKSADASTPEFMNEYADFLDRMADFEEKSNYYYSIEDNMSDADYTYFSASMLRIEAKLMRYSTTEF